VKIRPRLKSPSAKGGHRWVVNTRFTAWTLRGRGDFVGAYRRVVEVRDWFGFGSALPADRQSDQNPQIFMVLSAHRVRQIAYCAFWMLLFSLIAWTYYLSAISTRHCCSDLIGKFAIMAFNQLITVPLCRTTLTRRIRLSPVGMISCGSNIPKERVPLVFCLLPYFHETSDVGWASISSDSTMPLMRRWI